MDTSEILPREARRRQADGALLLDVREPDEQAAGMAADAISLPLADIDKRMAQLAPNQQIELITICAQGPRSQQAAAQLQKMGYAKVVWITGGTKRWIKDGLPLDPGDADSDFYDRYSRQLRLPEIGIDGQRKLGQSRVVVLGAGGLGSPAALYLAAAGIGTLVVADDDVVERSNLQRQILHTEARIGASKLDSAEQALHALNPRTRFVGFGERVTSANVEALLDGADVVIDGADNLATRYLLNDACVKLGKPLVYGAIQGFQGQASVFDAGRQRGQAPCYRCLYPTPPDAADVPSCSRNGVLGVLPGIIGLLQATEAIKLLLSIGTPLIGRLLMFDAMAMQFRDMALSADAECPVCAPGKPFPGYANSAPGCTHTNTPSKA